jgi:hypothetical protein
VPTTEESLEVIANATRDMAGRDIQFSLFGGKVVLSVTGRAVTTGAPGTGMGSPFSWVVEELDTEAPPTGNILEAPFRDEPLSIVLPTSLMETTTGPISIKDKSGHAGVYPITITGEGSEPFDGEPSIVIDTPYACVGIYPSGGAWHVLWFYGG